MGIPVLLLGESGSGKSTSLRNFGEKEIGIFNVASKPLPFRKKIPHIDGADYKKIVSSLANPKLKTYAIDDANYLMAFENFAKVNETGYQKFTTMAVNFYNLVQFVIQQMPSDCIVYFMMHTERDESGHIKAKTIGKMLDNQLCLEGLFSIVLMAKVENGKHFFETQSDGFNTAKSPMDMFDAVIDNDLKFVDDKIREYWGLNETAKKASE